MKVLQAQNVGVLVSKTGGWLPICMAIDMPPFDDVRVRQAMRLIVDRKGMLEQVISGYGFVGNDLYAPFDPGYDHSLPQRQQDIAQAKSLLKAVSHANLSRGPAHHRRRGRHGGYGDGLREPGLRPRASRST